ncbi:proton channel OtopLc isoform X1 [Topomyia yanbarensis]|uniref:proton channel OtopLc isoform X1 n=1 Tax=Topomyia yanbarensis TaxID=2498891 RepID=UPI00273C6C2E|nr:proton channel OtopLc isoform X1 [Topomyia yanbarensis]XP_058814132.1 proton channel OtopLc isoform X1 [Topomyia yanbarensis]
MDSSPDLSLKLRRGSSDSRDSFYMDFAQGIDSDIEDVTCASGGAISLPPSGSQTGGSVTTPSTLAPSIPDVTVLSACGTSHSGTGIIPEDPEDLDDDTELEPVPPPMPDLADHPSVVAGLGLPLPPLPCLDIDDRDMELPLQPIMPSPSVPQNAIVSPETFSNQSSPAPSLQHLAETTSTPNVDFQPEVPPHPPVPEEFPLPTDESRVGSSVDTASKTHHETSSSTSSAYQRIQTPTFSVKTNPIVIQPGAAPSGSSVVLPSPSNLHQQSPSGIMAGTTTTTQHLAVLYHSHHHHLHPILNTNRRPSRLPEPVYYQQREIKPGEALATTLSALYGKLLVVMGIAFPMAEVISTYIPPSFYEGFYLYLYIGSMVFLFFMYTTLLWGRPKTPVASPVKLSSSKKVARRSSTSTDSGERSDSEADTASSEPKVMIPMRRMSLSNAMSTTRIQHFGSFYLRMGAVAFGIGSMIYSGLEFGQYFELERDTKCHNVLLALTPATRMAFIFIQMYFIFLNNEQIKVYRHKILARFGLMHMIGTNLSVWFSVLIQETKHEILTFYNPENRTLRISHRLGNKLIPHPVETIAHLRVARGLKGPHNIFECRRSNIIGTLVQDASPFLFPCTIEYSLICAAILYVMWRSISRPQMDPVQRHENLLPMKRSPHHYSVDCAGAHKGLFIGILILVLTIISLILFFVLISRPEFVSLAVTEVNICELTLYGTTTAATLIGMIQVRHMQYDAFRSFSLDDILLVGGQTGSFLYSTFTVIGGQFMMRRDTVLVLITALASLVETACQTMFILDASRRSAATQEHIRKKPGREIVTFLLVSNLAMWAINTLEKSRAESHPIQLHFYGLWAWTIITHVSMPLAIFYRFHSTVCLCEIWKRAYKMKPAYM